MSEWKIAEINPYEGQIVIACGKLNKDYGEGVWVSPAIFRYGKFYPLEHVIHTGEYVANFCANYSKVTNWMPLPEPPSC